MGIQWYIMVYTCINHQLEIRDLMRFLALSENGDRILPLFFSLNFNSFNISVESRNSWGFVYRRCGDQLAAPWFHHVSLWGPLVGLLNMGHGTSQDPEKSPI